MSVLAEHQFEILPSEGANDGFVFGIGAEVSVESFDPGEAEWLTQDSPNTRRGNIGFGRDVLSGKTWVWDSHTDQEDVASAVNILDQFAGAWTPESLVDEPGSLTAIRYRLAGRYRRVFGRPRRFSAPPSNLILSGYVPVTHDFQCVDSHTYDDAESSAEITYSSSASGGGFILPATLPITMASSNGNGQAQVTVGGQARAYPVIRFNGPWTNPVMVTDDWTLKWTGSIAAGSWVEVDTRPWKLTVLNQDGASVVEGLSRRTWLEDLWFAPQSQPQIVLQGVAASGGASATIRWRNTWNSM